MSVNAVVLPVFLKKKKAFSQQMANAFVFCCFMFFPNVFFKKGEGFLFFHF
jgi:hypothetical protein